MAEVTIKTVFAQEHRSLGRIGRVGENLAREIVFDCAKVLEGNAGAQIVCAIKRPGDAQPYTRPMTADGARRYTLTLTAADVAKAGSVQMELRMVDGEAVLKTAIYTGIVSESIGGVGDAPGDPTADALNRLEGTIEAGSAATEAANTAAFEAAAIAEAASRAEADRTAAEKARVSVEKERVSAETDRAAAEEKRASEFANYAEKITEIDANTQANAAEIEEANAKMEVLEKAIRGSTYTSIEQIADIVRSSSLKQLEYFFPIGDQIIIPWKDMDDLNHNTDETAYQVELDIVHRGIVTLQDGSEVPGLYLQWHHCSPYGVQFSHSQAFLNCVDGLAAGTYYVTFERDWGRYAVGNLSWSFTLTKDVPAGGRLSGFERIPDADTSVWKVKSWSTPADDEPLEVVSVTSGASGTNLGVMPYNKPDEATGLNSMQRVAYGHNRWDTSALRQYLNSSGTGWWSSKGDYDIRPDQYAKTGFMSGFNDDFLNAIKPVRVTTALNTAEGYADDTVDTYDTFFLPSLEQMYINPQLPGAEGEYWEYWRSRLGVDAPVNQYRTYPNLITTSLNEKTSPQYVHLRSVYSAYSCYTWIIYTSGYVGYNGVSLAHKFSPVCVIC